MEHLQENIVRLYQKWLDQTATDEDQQQLLQLLGSVSAEDELSPAMRQVWDELSLQQPGPTGYARKRIEAVLKRNPAGEEPASLPVTLISFIRRWRWIAAASVILLLATGAYLWVQHSREQVVTSNSRQSPADIEPGKDGAILTLADGSQVVLDSLGNGIIAHQTGAQVVLNNGELTYQASTQTHNSSLITYNSLTTPKGRQFNLRLPDGTRVWLNAASSIRYPTIFSGNERRIEISGEAYFEIAKDKAKPFFVQLNNEATVEVLGTSFNVNAYEDEASINTTLIEGSIRTSVVYPDRPEDSENVILKPGQQAQVVNTRGRLKDAASKGKVGQKTEQGIKLVDADIDKVMAWKNGAFNFDDVELEEVMRQLERWYDIDVVYKGAIPDIRFFGKISRNENLSFLLKALEASKVHFRLEEGRRLIVLP